MNIHQACFIGCVDYVKAFISSGKDINVIDAYNETPLHIICDQLGKLCTHVDACFIYGLTPTPSMLRKLLLFEDIASALITAGADVTAQSIASPSILFIACMLKTPDLLSLVLAAGADPNARNAANQTAMDVALIRNSLKHVMLLLKAGAHADNVRLIVTFGFIPIC